VSDDGLLLYCQGNEWEGGCEPVLLPRLSSVGQPDRYDITTAEGWTFDPDEGFWRCPNHRKDTR